MTKPYLSICVPFYNRFDYLRKCLESILMQSFDDYEVLMLDDCSTDNSSIIAKEYCLKDKRFKLFSFDKKERISTCRNYLLSKCKGELITFIDSDDYLTNASSLKVIVDSFSKDYDLLVFSMQCIDENDHLLNQQTFLYDDNKITFGETIDSYLFFARSTVGSNLLNKVFRHSIIDSNNIHFPDGIDIGEDYVFLLLYSLKISNILVLSDVVYSYLVHSSLSSINTKDYKFENHYKQNYFIFENIKNKYDYNLAIKVFNYMTFSRYFCYKPKEYIKTIRYLRKMIPVNIINSMKEKINESWLDKKEKAFAKSYFSFLYRYFVFPLKLLIIKVGL